MNDEASTRRAYCFILMPFGKKPDPRGGPDIDYDAVYDKALQPAIEDAGLVAIRADAERTGGIIHKAMFERLLMCEFAVADLTGASANVFYELGIRHAARAYTTLPIFAEGHAPPFDLNLVRCLPYSLGPDNAFGDDEAATLRAAVKERLEVLKEEYRKQSTDSPVFQLIQTLEPPDIDRLRTDTFRERLDYEERARKILAQARRDGDLEAMRRFQESLDGLADEELGVLTDLFLSYRAVKGFPEMVELYEAMPPVLQRTRMIREQLGFALNRLGRSDEAIEVLSAVIREFGVSSETNGLLGRVHKDRWDEAKKAGQEAEARGHLRKAIASYREGFEADPRDAYPGVNAVTLLEIEGKPESLEVQRTLLPVVRFAVERRIRAIEAADYWDHATRLELAVLARDEQAAREYLDDALAEVREVWEPETTAKNLRLIKEARGEDDADRGWLEHVLSELLARAKR